MFDYEKYSPLDKEGYPTEKALKAIEEWPQYDFKGLLDFVESIWEYAEWGWDKDEDTGIYHISTAGWSGNESIIGALKTNFMFWQVCWESERRGGHFVFTLPENNDAWVENHSEFAYIYKLTEPKLEAEYNPRYGDERVCKCGHLYYRHFDTYEDMRNVGCKYCGCLTFEEGEEQ